MVIYKTTHIPSGKMYIGKDTQNNPNYFGSGVELKKIIEKEGKINLKKEILEYCDNKQTLAEKEIYYLSKYDAENNPLFLNKTNKAFGNSGQTEEGKAKISKAHKGRKQPSKTKAKKSKSIQRYWDNLTPQQRKERGELTKVGRMNKSGYIVSEETKRKMSIKAKQPKLWKRKKVIQYDLDMNIITTYNSANEAKKATNLKIQNALAGITKTCGGFIWRYDK